MKAIAIMLLGAGIVLCLLRVALMGGELILAAAVAVGVAALDRRP
jgi:hypothetical protein